MLLLLLVVVVCEQSAETCSVRRLLSSACSHARNVSSVMKISAAFANSTGASALIICTHKLTQSQPSNYSCIHTHSRARAPPPAGIQERVDRWKKRVKQGCSNNVRRQGIAPGASKQYVPADGSSIQKPRRIYIRPQMGPQLTHLW